MVSNPYRQQEWRKALLSSRCAFLCSFHMSHDLRSVKWELNTAIYTSMLWWASLCCAPHCIQFHPSAILPVFKQWCSGRKHIQNRTSPSRLNLRTWIVYHKKIHVLVVFYSWVLYVFLWFWTLEILSDISNNSIIRKKLGSIGQSSCSASIKSTWMCWFSHHGAKKWSRSLCVWFHFVLFHFILKHHFNMHIRGRTMAPIRYCSA